jgi:hypothetical protein
LLRNYKEPIMAKLYKKVPTTFFGPGMLWTEWMSGWSPKIEERRPGYSESGLPIRDYCERCKTTFWEHEGHQCEAGVAA